jgi:hypothetical protein
MPALWRAAKSLQLIETCPEDRPFAADFRQRPDCDATPPGFWKSGVDSIDINMSALSMHDENGSGRA